VARASEERPRSVFRPQDVGPIKLRKRSTAATEDWPVCSGCRVYAPGSIQSRGPYLSVISPVAYNWNFFLMSWPTRMR
jgi:hypothetical protein